MLEVEYLKAVLRGGNGADDEVTRRAVESHGEEDHLVGGGGDHRGDGPDDETLAGAAGKGRQYRGGGRGQSKTGRKRGAGGRGGEKSGVCRRADIARGRRALACE